MQQLTTLLSNIIIITGHPSWPPISSNHNKMNSFAHSFKTGFHADMFVRYMPSLAQEFWVEVFIESTSNDGDDYPTIPKRGLVGGSPTSKRSMQRLSTWMEACKNEHHLCNQLQARHTPHRVLEVLSPNGENTFRLKEPEEIFAYIALSHCRGQEGAILPLRTIKNKHWNAQAFIMLGQSF